MSGIFQHQSKRGNTVLRIFAAAALLTMSQSAFAEAPISKTPRANSFGLKCVSETPNEISEIDIDLVSRFVYFRSRAQTESIKSISNDEIVLSDYKDVKGSSFLRINRLTGLWSMGWDSTPNGGGKATYTYKCEKIPFRSMPVAKF